MVVVVLVGEQRASVRETELAKQRSWKGRRTAANSMIIIVSGRKKKTQINRKKKKNILSNGFLPEVRC